MRPVGNHIRACMQASDDLCDWATAGELYRHAGLNITTTVCTKVLRRAVVYGLAEIDESRYPLRFRALPGWRRRIEMPHISNPAFVPKKPAEAVVAPVIQRKVINSVWSLAA